MKIECNNYNGVWNPILTEAVKLGHEVNTEGKPDILLHWTDKLETCRADILRYKDAGIPVVIMQHGIEAFSDFYYSERPIADLYLAWDDYDRWLARKYGVKNVKVVGYEYLWEEPQIPVDVPKDYYLYVPNHYKKMREFYVDELAEVRLRAEYAGLPLVVKTHPELWATKVVGATLVSTDPASPDHLGKLLFTLQNAKQAYIVGKSTARILLEARNKPVAGLSRGIWEKVQGWVSNG